MGEPTMGIPDAVLNRTACLIASPADTTNGPFVSGFASCRNRARQWTSPVVVHLSIAADVRPHSDLLLLVLSERARRELVDGRLNLQSGLRVAPGPTTEQARIVDQAYASQDVFAYTNGNGAIRGMDPPRALIAVDREQTGQLYGHDLDTRQLLDGGTMSSTVTSFYAMDVSSFFNTIAPIGIIIHHSVLVPGTELPEVERELDRFHDSRGFEISCFGKVYHIAYHYLILPNGEIRSGRPERCEGAHARGYNSYLGIALIGNFSSHAGSRAGKGVNRPTQAQLASLVRLCCYLRQKYSIPLQHIMPHSDVSRTECPGDGLKFSTILAQISRDSGAGS